MDDTSIHIDIPTVRAFVHSLIVALSVVQAALLAIEKLLGADTVAALRSTRK